MTLRLATAAATASAACADRPQARINRVSVAAVVVMVLIMLALLGRVAQLQIAPSELLAAHIDERTTTVREPGVRGDILDRRGRLLAGSRFAHRVFIDPVRFPTPPDEAMIRLADVTGVPLETIVERLIPAMAENERRGRSAGAASPAERSARADSPLAPLASLVGLGGRDAGHDSDDSDPDRSASKALIRYISIGRPLDDWRVDMVRAAKIPGVHLELRAVRQLPAPELTASLVGAVGVDHNGILGAELMLDKQIRATPGRLRYVRDARSRPLWVEQGGYTAPVRGEDARLSIDLELQRIAHEELSKAVGEYDAAGGRLVLLDSHTGEILAMVDIVRRPADAVEFDWDNPAAMEVQRRYITIRGDPSTLAHPALARNRCVEDVYEPGSTFKAFMWSATTALGLADPKETVNTESGVWTVPYARRTVRDVVKRPTMTWAEVLVNSSNIGMAKTTRRMSDKQMRDAVLRFGFGSRTNIGLPGESPGIVTTQKNWSKYTQTSVAMGYEVAVTPVQMVRAFSAFARTGEQAGTIVPPTLLAVDPASSAAGATLRPRPEPIRVLPADIANLTRETMRRVTQNMDERLARTRKGEPAPRYELFGKSGTAKIPMTRPPGKKRPRGWRGYYENQYNTSFIAAGPAESPRLVCLVVIDDPGPELVRKNTYYGAQTAGPVVRRVMERSLAYLGVPPSLPAGRDE